VRRFGFLIALIVCCAGGPTAAGAQSTADFTLSRTDMQQIVATVKQIRIVRVWKPASALPAFSPLALPKRRTAADGDSAQVWINIDHLELMTPRISQPSDEDAVVAAAIGGTLDLHLDIPGWKHLETHLNAMAPGDRYPTIIELGKLLVSAFGVRTKPGVSDDEFERELFPFAVIRNMTPGVPGVNADELPAGATMPKDAPLIAYIGRTDVRYPGTPVIWGDSKHTPPNFTKAPEFLDLYMRAYILATADMQAANTPEKQAYEAARASDERSGPGTYAARYAFAAPYLPRVRALVSH
jgi:hypothetical protein